CATVLARSELIKLLQDSVNLFRSHRIAQTRHASCILVGLLHASQAEQETDFGGAPLRCQGSSGSFHDRWQNPSYSISHSRETEVQTKVFESIACNDNCGFLPTSKLKRPIQAELES